MAKSWTGWNGDNDPSSGCLLQISGTTRATVWTTIDPRIASDVNLEPVCVLEADDVLVYLGKFKDVEFKNPTTDLRVTRWFYVFTKAGPGWMRANRLRPVNWELYVDL